ncbi:hypothetical protein CU098_006916, partial [Rhizopus stolonifer]
LNEDRDIIIPLPKPWLMKAHSIILMNTAALKIQITQEFLQAHIVLIKNFTDFTTTTNKTTTTKITTRINKITNIKITTTMNIATKITANIATSTKISSFKSNNLCYRSFISQGFEEATSFRNIAS